MKQFQFEYKNINSYNRSLARIKRFYDTIAHASIFFQFFTAEKDFEVIKPIMELAKYNFPDAVCYGSQTYGNIVDGCMASDKTVIVCSIFEYTTTHTEMLFVEPHNPEARLHSLKDLWDYCEQIEDLQGIELSMTIKAADTFRAEENFINLDPQVHVFGGLAIDPEDYAIQNSKVFTLERGLLEDVCIAVILAGKDLHIETTYFNGWEGLGKHFMVTKSEGKVVQEIDNEPAMNIYRKYLGIEVDENFKENTMRFPLLVTEHGVPSIRLPLASKTENVNDINLPIEVPKGTSLRLAYGEPSTILNNINSHLDDIFKFAPETIRIYSCAVRRIYWNNDRVSLETMQFDGIAPTIGYYTGGELLRIHNHLHYFNSTMVVSLVREGEAVEPDFKLEHIVDKDIQNGVFSSKLLHYLGAVTKEIEASYEATLSEKEELAKHMAKLAVTDNQTGLYNRRSYEIDVFKLKQNIIQERMVYAYVDINGLKEVNDTLGHAAGDELIAAVAECMSMAFSKYGKVYRIGGDEFVAIIYAQDNTLLSIKKDFDNSIRSWHGAQVKNISVAVGYVTSKEMPDASIEDIERIADKRMYKAKKSFYDNKD